MMAETWRVRVTATPSWKKNPPKAAVTAERVYPALKGWHIVAVKTNGLVERSLGFVLRTSYGKVIVAHDGAMVDCWHIGISAGDLARNYAKRSGLDVVTGASVLKPWIPR